MSLFLLGRVSNIAVVVFRIPTKGMKHSRRELAFPRVKVNSKVFKSQLLTPTCPNSDTSTFSTFSVGEVTQVGLSQNETYELPEPGPVPDRQDVPHLHDAVLDPTGQFIIVPDLGADTLHVYSIVPETIKWVELEPVKAVPGNGPRHGEFAVTADNHTFFYLANELSNTITGYRVSYEDEDGQETAAPLFEQLFDISTHGEGGHVPNGTKAAEIEISVGLPTYLLTSLAIPHNRSFHSNLAPRVLYLSAIALLSVPKEIR